MNKIIPPTKCPSCGSELEWRNKILYCENSSCGAKQAKEVEHFAKTIKIKGLGPESIKKLELREIADIYSMDQEYISNKLGSTKLAEKLANEIQSSTQRDLISVLPAMGVPLIGRSATEKLALVISSLWELSEEKCSEAGLGPKATYNLMEWYNNNKEWLKALPFTWSVSPRETAPDSDEIVCITGRLSSFKTKAEAKKVLEAKGYKVVDNLTKAVTILINESGIESAKTRKAQLDGVLIVDNINLLLGE